MRFEGFQPFVYVGDGFVHVFRLFEFLVFIDALFDKDFLQGGKEELFFQFAFLNLQLHAEQAQGLVGGMFQHLADRHEMGLVVHDDAAVRRDADLAVGEGIERVDRLVGRDARRQMHQDFDVARRVVVDLLYLDFAFVVGFQYRVNQRRGGFPVGNLADDERFVVLLGDFGTHFHRAAPLAVVVFRDVDVSARLEIGIEREIFPFEIGDGGVEQFVEVVGQNLGRESHRDAFHALRQQQREFDRKRHRLAVAPVVGELPDGRFGVEHRFQGEFGQARFDVTGCGRAVARQDVSPVPLAVNQQVFLS